MKDESLTELTCALETTLGETLTALSVPYIADDKVRNSTVVRTMIMKEAQS